MTAEERPQIIAALLRSFADQLCNPQQKAASFPKLDDNLVEQAQLIEMKQSNKRPAENTESGDITNTEFVPAVAAVKQATQSIPLNESEPKHDNSTDNNNNENTRNNNDNKNIQSDSCIEEDQQQKKFKIDDDADLFETSEDDCNFSEATSDGMMSCGSSSCNLHAYVEETSDSN